MLQAQTTCLCPSGCGKNEAAVYGGVGKYSESSSICRAALHTGKIDDNGGIITIQVDNGIKEGKSYEASKANDIDTII